MESRNIRMFFNDRRFKRNWSLRTETTRPLVAFRLVYESTFMTISIENVRTPPWAKTNVYESLTVSLWKLLRHYLELHSLKHQIFSLKKVTFSWHHSKSFSIAPFGHCSSLALVGQKEPWSSPQLGEMTITDEGIEGSGNAVCGTRAFYAGIPWNLRTEVFVWKEHPLPTFIFAF